MSALSFKIIAGSQVGGARVTEVATSRNTLLTPCFMPVGTYGAVSGLTPQLLSEMGAEILVCNAFRLTEKPGESVLSKFESLHEFMAWPKTILTDSGGFQVYRLEDRVVSDEGVKFYESGRGAELWSPERAIAAQVTLGSDFVMPLDVCVELPTTYAEAKGAVERTLNWAGRCQAAFRQAQRPGQTLFGIVQGAIYADLRRRCVEELERYGVEAYAIGGLNVGETAEEYRATLAITSALLPPGKLRYIMGVGRPEAMLEAVSAGVDIMDSIIPTKYAREGTLFTARGPINLFTKKFRRDKYPVDTSCNCYTCRNVSRAYLHHLYTTTRTTAQVFSSIHNVTFCIELFNRARQAIVEGRFEKFHAEFLENYVRKADRSGGPGQSDDGAEPLPKNAPGRRAQEAGGPSRTRRSHG